MFKEIEFMNASGKIKKKLRDCINKYHLSIEEVVIVCDVSRSTIFKILRGGYLTPRSLYKISEGIKKIEERDCTDQ